MKKLLVTTVCSYMFCYECMFGVMVRKARYVLGCVC
uniref:IDP154 n=1 Tax=Arundo donax TaxID=35708 RepID=A0A0A8XUF3_ARUDO